MCGNCQATDYNPSPTVYCLIKQNKLQTEETRQQPETMILTFSLIYVMCVGFCLSRSAKEAEEKIKKALDKGEVLPTEARFDSNCITPGRDDLTSYVRIYPLGPYYAIESDTLITSPSRH